MNLLDDVTRVLAASGVPHAVIGAAALAAAGVARSTYDVDLLTADARVLERTLWEELLHRGVHVDIRRGDEEDPLGGVVRVEAARERPVDVILARHSWQGRIVDRASRVENSPPVALPADLILLKLYAGGSQDLWDVRELLRQPAAPAWAASVERELTALPAAMRERWASVRNA